MESPDYETQRPETGDEVRKACHRSSRWTGSRDEEVAVAMQMRLRCSRSQTQQRPAHRPGRLLRLPEARAKQPHDVEPRREVQCEPHERHPSVPLLAGHGPPLHRRQASELRKIRSQRHNRLQVVDVKLPEVSDVGDVARLPGRTRDRPHRLPEGICAVELSFRGRRRAGQQPKRQPAHRVQGGDAYRGPVGPKAEPAVPHYQSRNKERKNLGIL